MAEPLFSVIATTHNRPQFLPDALDSVRAQTVEDFECVVVDDGSEPPATLPFADARFRIVRRDRAGGVGAARNTGLDAAIGRYVTFLDDDDIYVPERLEYGLEAMRHAPVGVCWMGDLATQEPLARTYGFGNIYETVHDPSRYSVSVVTMPRDLALRFDERYRVLGDIDWWLRTARRHEVHTVLQVGSLFRWHSGPRLTKNLEARMRARALLFSEHRDYFESRPHLRAMGWAALSWVALHHNRFLTSGHLFFRAVREWPTLSGVRMAWRKLRLFRELRMKVLGSVRKRWGLRLGR